MNEFFCHDDTWRPTMLRLAQAADVVLMGSARLHAAEPGLPLRAAQLLDFVPLERVLVLIDAGAPRAFIEGTLQTLWQASRADSPNRAAMPARLRLLEDRGETTVALVVDALLEEARAAAAAASLIPGVSARGDSSTDDEDATSTRTAGRSSAAAVTTENSSPTRRPARTLSPPYFATLEIMSSTSTRPPGRRRAFQILELTRQPVACLILRGRGHVGIVQRKLSPRSPPKTTVTV